MIRRYDKYGYLFVRNVVHGIGTYSLDRHGYIIEDPKGSNTGIDWLRKNIKQIDKQTACVYNKRRPAPAGAGEDHMKEKEG